MEYDWKANTGNMHCKNTIADQDEAANNRLQGTPNRANARPGAPEAERYRRSNVST